MAQSTRIALFTLALIAFMSTASLVAAGDAAKGARIYDAQKCSLCHKVAAKGGTMGPDLSGVGSKHDAAWFAKYLPDPKSVVAQSKMPPTKVSAKDLDDLIAYLGTLKAK
jgi:cytochrome c2